MVGARRRSPQHSVVSDDIKSILLRWALDLDSPASTSLRGSARLCTLSFSSRAHLESAGLAKQRV